MEGGVPLSEGKLKRSSKLMWMGVEARPQEEINGHIQVSRMFHSYTSRCLIHCTGIGRTISEALSVMMKEYHQRR